jgi:hypothetical protein
VVLSHQTGVRIPVPVPSFARRKPTHRELRMASPSFADHSREGITPSASSRHRRAKAVHRSSAPRQFASEGEHVARHPRCPTSASDNRSAPSPHRNPIVFRVEFSDGRRAFGSSAVEIRLGGCVRQSASAIVLGVGPYRGSAAPSTGRRAGRSLRRVNPAAARSPISWWIAAIPFSVSANCVE